MKARYLVSKGKKLEDRLHRLQSDIYYYADELGELGLTEYDQLATESGFELDVSHSKMKELWERLENAYCRRISKK